MTYQKRAFFYSLRSFLSQMLRRPLPGQPTGKWSFACHFMIAYQNRSLSHIQAVYSKQSCRSKLRKQPKIFLAMYPVYFCKVLSAVILLHILQIYNLCSKSGEDKSHFISTCSLVSVFSWCWYGLLRLKFYECEVLYSYSSMWTKLNSYPYWCYHWCLYIWFYMETIYGTAPQMEAEPKVVLQTF